MSKTYSGIINDAEALVQDAGIDPSGSANQVFATAELDSFMPAALAKISQYKPWQIKTTKSTVTSTRDITLSTGDKWRLLGIEKLEYLTDKNPPIFRNYTRFGDVLSIKIDAAPPAIADIYFFWNKVHLLQKSLDTDDTEGKVKTAGDEGDVTLALDNLGTGDIDEITTLAIAGDSTVYYVIKTVTIATNEATVSIWPPLQADAAALAVVTLSVTGSTLDMPLEDYLARLLAARACISKATKSYAQVNQAITEVADASTAIGEIAALITLATADTTGDIALGRTAAALLDEAIVLANAEFGLMNVEVDLAKTALASGNSLINTIPVGGGASEYMGQAASNVGVAQGYLSTGQSYLQQASAGGVNATAHFNAATADFRAASEKADEAIVNLRLVATRLQVSQGGLRYEEWGRRELTRVEAELRAYGGYHTSVRYSRG